MTIGNEIAYRRGRGGKDSTGSLVFDQERRRQTPAKSGARKDTKDGSSVAATKSVKRKLLEDFPG